SSPSPFTSSSCLVLPSSPPSSPFFFNAAPTTEIYTLSLHDALPISWYFIRFTDPWTRDPTNCAVADRMMPVDQYIGGIEHAILRSEEHTSELQSRFDLVCRLLLEKKKKPREVVVYT